MSGKTILVAHPEPMVAQSLAAALGRYAGIDAVVTASSVFEVDPRTDPPDAAAVDSRLPHAEDLIAILRRRSVRVVVLDCRSESPRRARAPSANAADGEPPQNGSGADLTAPVRVSTLAPLDELAGALVPDCHRVESSRLTPREHQILSLVSRGLAGKQVARTLGISHKTVENHKSRIFSKLGVSNQTAACLAVLDELRGT